MSVKSALVIGAGRIGARFDRPGDSSVLTHAHAYSTHPAFKLVGFVDPSREACVEAARTWGGRAFDSIKSAMTEAKPEIVSIASPDENHAQQLLDVLCFKPKLVFAEKPLALDLSAARDVVAAYAKAGVPLLLNYSRRFVPELKELARSIASDKHGKLLSGAGHYGKGLVHNGTHMIDLLRMLLGSVEPIGITSSLVDFTQEDPSVSGLVRAGGTQIALTAVDSRAFSLFELDLIFERARIRIVGSGFKILSQDVGEDAVFAGYRKLGSPVETPTDFGRALYHAVNNIDQHLASGEALVCSGEDGIAALEIASKLRQKRLA